MATTIFSEADGVKEIYVLEGEGRQDKITEVQARIRNRNRTDNKKWVRLDQKKTPPTPVPVLAPAEVTEVTETDMDAVIERDPVTESLDDEAVNEDVTETAEPVIVDQPAAEPADAQPVKRGRGRPKKDPNAPVTPKAKRVKKVAVAAPKRRGRPPGAKAKAKSVVIAGKKIGKRGRPPGVKNKVKSVFYDKPKSLGYSTVAATTSNSGAITDTSTWIRPSADDTLRLMISELFSGVTSITITRGEKVPYKKTGKRGRPAKAK